MKKLFPLLIASTIGIIILCGLGTWQVFRLAEKTKLVAALDARMQAEPISLAQALERHAKGEDIEYLKVTAEGRSDPAHALRKITSFEGKPGWEIIVPFTSTDGIFILVDAGATPDVQIATASADNETITGVIRVHHKGRGFFDNDNDETGNTWYWWDLPAMQAAAGAPAEARIAPFILQKLPSAENPSPPYAQKPKVELKNNHLGYAITWFGLAAALMAVAGFFTRSLVLDRKGQDS
jgi:surfeit locus 1 family protein